MLLVGFVELFGSVGLWLPEYLGISGALALFTTSIGAVFFHFYFDTWKDAIPAMITLMLSGAVLYSQYFEFGMQGI